MMRSGIWTTILIVICMSPGMGTTHTITTSGFTFVPNSISIVAGDTVIFSIPGIHNAVEVSQATWNANDTTSLPGGFHVNFAGASAFPTQLGTHYYFCQPPVSSFCMQG